MLVRLPQRAKRFRLDRLGRRAGSRSPLNFRSRKGHCPDLRERGRSSIPSKLVQPGKRITLQYRYAFREGDIRQAAASAEGIGRDRRDAARDRDRLQTRAAAKAGGADLRQAARELDLLQTRAAGKGGGAELYKAVGEVDARQRGAILKSGEADVRYARGDRDLLQTRAAGKGTVGDAGTSARKRRSGCPDRSRRPQPSRYSRPFSLSKMSPQPENASLPNPTRLSGSSTPVRAAAAGKGVLPDLREAAGEVDPL